MGKSTISMVIFNSYVKLPEGICVFVSPMCWRLEMFTFVTDHHYAPTSPFYPRSFSTIFPSYPDYFPIISFMIFSFYPNDPPIIYRRKKRHDFPCLLYYSQRYHHVFHVTIGFILGFTTVSPHDTLWFPQHISHALRTHQLNALHCQAAHQGILKWWDNMWDIIMWYIYIYMYIYIYVIYVIYVI